MRTGRPRPHDCCGPPQPVQRRVARRASAPPHACGRRSAQARCEPSRPTAQPRAARTVERSLDGIAGVPLFVPASVRRRARAMPGRRRRVSHVLVLLDADSGYLRALLRFLRERPRPLGSHRQIPENEKPATVTVTGPPRPPVDYRRVQDSLPYTGTYLPGTPFLLDAQGASAIAGWRVNGRDGLVGRARCKGRPPYRSDRSGLISGSPAPAPDRVGRNAG